MKEAVAELADLYKTVLEALKRKQQNGRATGRLSKGASPLGVYAVVPDSVRKVAVSA